MTEDRNDLLKKTAGWALLGVLFLGFVFYGIASIVQWWRTRDSKLANLVVEIQKNIQAIDAKKSETGWEVGEAEVEVNFVIKESTENKTELKASSGTLGTEREDTGRLLLKLHRTPSVIESKGPAVTPDKREPMKADQPAGKAKKQP